MTGESSEHEALTEELIELWEGLWQENAPSGVVLVAVPPGWGRTTVLDRLAAAATADEAPVTLMARVSCRVLPDESGLQAAAVREHLGAAASQHRVAELLGLDRLGGITQMGLGVGGLFVSDLAALVGFLVTGIAIGAAGKAWDDTPAGMDGALARIARAVAETSTQVPVIVLIDDADHLDEDVALTLIESLVGRRDGHVLVVAAVDPAGTLKKALVSRAWRGITEGLVRVADADPDMGYSSRIRTLRELLPALPQSVSRQIAKATASYAELFAVAAAPVLAEPGQDEATLLKTIGKIIASRLHRPDPSPAAVITAWAGGLLHARQARAALKACGEPPAGAGDPDLIREANLQRVLGAGSPRMAGQVEALATDARRAMADVLLEEALAIGEDAACGLAEQVAAAQAALHVEDDLTDQARLPRLQRRLAAALEDLGEPAAALQVAAAALGSKPRPAEARRRDSDEDWDWLSATALRLSALAHARHQPEVVAELMNMAVTDGGASLGLEARIWAAVELLSAEGQRASALDLTERAAAALDKHAKRLGQVGDRWRLLLAYHAGRAGHAAIASRLLAPLLGSGNERREQAAETVLRSCAGPQADTRLQTIMLEAELAALHPDAEEDRLRIHHALAMNYDKLGDYRQALAQAERELVLQSRIQASGSPRVMTTRNNIASWTGDCGDVIGALRQLRELAADMKRVLGADHPDTMKTRNNLAHWSGQSGDAAGALRQFRDLLADRKRVLGSNHPDTLLTRANRAYWVGESGDPARAVRLLRELLPDRLRVLGPDHPDTLKTRSNIGFWTGQCGDAAGALRQFVELLRDEERVLGADHPDTMIARGNIAQRTGECGDAAGALRQFQDLLADQERVLGPDARYVLRARYNIADWTGECGDVTSALSLFRKVLADQERVLGPDHPDAVITRRAIVYWTGKRGSGGGNAR